MKKCCLISFALALLFSCGREIPKKEGTIQKVNKNEVSLSDAQFRNAAIESGKITQKEISAILKVNGKIDVPPQNMISLSMPLGGYLKSTKLLEGMHIRKGEIIAVMEDEKYVQLQQDYLTAKANLSVLEKEFQRQKELNQNKASSDKIFENSKAVYENQKILLKSLAEKLNLIHLNPEKVDFKTISAKINIYSPIDGFVAKVLVNVGKYVNPADILFELVNNSDIHLTLTVYEKDINKLFIGQKLIAYTNNDEKEKHEAEIILIGRELSPERAILVHCHFEQYDKKLIPGMYMNAEIEISTHKAFAIPEGGLVRYEGKQYVFIETAEKKYLLQEVQTKDSENGYTQISLVNNADIANKTFVTKGAYTLLMVLKNKEEEE